MVKTRYETFEELLHYCELVAASISDISSAARVTKPMLYYYFGDKEGLYVHALENAYRLVREGEAKLDTDGLPPLDALRDRVVFVADLDRLSQAFAAVDQDRVTAEADVDVQQPDEAVPEQSGAHEHDERERHLARRPQGAARGVVACAGRPDERLEVAAGVTTFVLAGRYFEVRAKRRAGAARRIEPVGIGTRIA